MPTILRPESSNWHGSPVGQGGPFTLWAIATPPLMPPEPPRSTLDPDRGYYGETPEGLAPGQRGERGHLGHRDAGPMVAS